MLTLHALADCFSAQILGLSYRFGLIVQVTQFHAQKTKENLYACCSK
jgi:hypothetical protein